METYTQNEIKNLSYVEFVAFINQWNVLPGAYSTLSKFARFSNLNDSSYLLEVACSTGFSSRELAILTGCKGVAFDICRASIETAKYNKKEYAPDIEIKYICKDGYKFKHYKKFTHIIIGASLKFLPNPRKMLQRCLTMLSDGGYILASPFYIVKDIPAYLIEKARKVFGITITTESYKEIMALYEPLEIIFEERNNLFKETETELKHYCESTIKRACEIRHINDKNLCDAMYKRLYEVKRMSNELRPYQNYSVLVLRYRSKTYPNRFVELF